MTAQLSRERLEEIRYCTWMDDLGLSMAELNEMARMLLAAMDSVPVAYIGKQMLESLCDEGGRTCGRVWRSNTDELSRESRIPLYAAPPSPLAVPVPDERAALESFMAERFGDCIDRRRVKNGDGEYMAWDMQVAWIVWQRRAMLKAGPVTAATVPDGWKLVPVEPTDDMCEAGFKATDKYPFERFDNYREMHRCWALPRYKAMLAAAPAAPEQE